MEIFTGLESVEKLSMGIIFLGMFIWAMKLWVEGKKQHLKDVTDSYESRIAMIEKEKEKDEKQAERDVTYYRNKAQEREKLIFQLLNEKGKPHE
jgi:hypothetical protein